MQPVKRDDNRGAGRWSRLFSFTRREQRGLLFFLPLAAIIGTLLVFSNRPHFEKSFLAITETGSGPEGATFHISGGGSAPVGDTPTLQTVLFEFDPNTVTIQQLCSLGFDARVAAGIIKYRQRGKRFEIPEDFAACYGVTIEDYTRLEPYIIIDDRFRISPRSDDGYSQAGGGPVRGYGFSSSAPTPSQRDIPVIGQFDLNLLDAAGFMALGFSPRQAEAIVRYRESMGGFRSTDDFARCYVVSQADMERLVPYMVITVSGAGVATDDNIDTRAAGSIPDSSQAKQLVELNGADSALLRTVSGIGEATVVRIIEYRRRLGGFVRMEQLAEIQGMTEANYERICKQIRIDSCEIQKIDVNFASHKNLADRLQLHPYVSDKMIRKLLKERQLKGGWSSIEDMVEQHIMTRQEAGRLAPYLVFKPLL